jgi:cell division septation protein DedD
MSTKMTVSLHKKSKEKRYRNVSAPSDTNLDAPLTDDLDDEDAIDRLLMNTGFDAEDGREFSPLWDELKEAWEDPADFSPFTDSALANKIEPLLTACEEDSATALSMADTDQDLPKLSPIDDIGASDIADFAIEPEPWIMDEPPAFLRAEAAGEENLHIEGPVEPEAIPLQNKLNEADLAEIPVRSGRGESFFIDEAAPAAYKPETSARPSFDAEDRQLLSALEAKAKKAILLSYIAVGISIGSAAAAIALATSQSPQEVSGLSAQAGLPKEDASGPAQKTGNGKSAGNDASSGSLIPVSMPVSQEAAQGQTALIEKPLAAGGQSQPLDEVFASPDFQYSKSGWFVNLHSFRQRSDAEKQALEYIKKGIRTEIVAVEVNQAPWYRLRVGGFTRQEQATAYAEKIKKPLQLESIWIASY